MVKIVKYEWEYIGIEHSQYFVGRGTAYTDWDAVFVGIGDDCMEAMSDALEGAAQSGYDVDKVDTSVVDMSEVVEYDEDYDGDNELYYHVALWIKGESND